MSYLDNHKINNKNKKNFLLLIIFIFQLLEVNSTSVKLKVTVKNKKGLKIIILGVVLSC